MHGRSVGVAVDLNGDGENVHVDAAVAAHGHAGECIAVLEGAGLDVTHALRDGDVGQGGAAVEGGSLNVLHAIGQSHGGQVGAALEGAAAHGGHTGFHDHSGDLVGLIRPGSGGVAVVVGHTAGAADGQGAVGQGPGHVLAAGVVAGGSSGCSGGSGAGSSRRCAAAAAGQGDAAHSQNSGSGQAAQTGDGVAFHLGNPLSYSYFYSFPAHHKAVRRARTGAKTAL